MAIFDDGPEYIARLNKDYSPPKATLKQIHDAVPRHLHKKSTLRGISWAVRDALLCFTFFKMAQQIDLCVVLLQERIGSSWVTSTVKWSLWATYWLFQGIVGGGIFCLGHDAGHGSLSDIRAVNHAIGFMAHTFILAPYYAWRHSHHLHHNSTGSMERDENYVPRTRSQLKMKPASEMSRSQYVEMFEETPLFAIIRLIGFQLAGIQVYLTFNAMGSPQYPPGASHWFPSSPLFKKINHTPLILSNIGLALWVFTLALWTYQTSMSTFLKFFFVPYLLTNHWIVMFTSLNHTDPTIPHFRGESWSFVAGAAAGVDRPLMGWIGRFFFHNLSTDHITHHFFSSIPFYNLPEATKAVQTALGDDYNYDSTNIWRALYRSFTQCKFVEDDGSVVFYLNGYGECSRKAA